MTYALEHTLLSGTGCGRGCFIGIMGGRSTELWPGRHSCAQGARWQCQVQPLHTAHARHLDLRCARSGAAPGWSRGVGAAILRRESWSEVLGAGSLLQASHEQVKLDGAQRKRTKKKKKGQTLFYYRDSIFMSWKLLMGSAGDGTFLRRLFFSGFFALDSPCTQCLPWETVT